MIIYDPKVEKEIKGRTNVVIATTNIIPNQHA
jgi:hypothetical protein